jgi:CheY-like chemotaxis protein
MLTRDKVSSWAVLIVDDEPDSLEVATRVLKYHGASVLVAPNGKEAIEILKTQIPTFILSDLSMPMMDGWSLIEHLKSNPRTADVPVIALTAHAMSGDRERSLAAGFHHYLTKPLSPLTFLEDLLRLFGEASAPPESIQDVQAASEPSDSVPPPDSVPAVSVAPPDIIPPAPSGDAPVDSVTPPRSDAA